MLRLRPARHIPRIFKASTRAETTWATPMTHPRVGLGVFVFKSRQSNELAWGLRKNSLGHGTWSLPGGHLEFGESFVECAVRETKEETGLEIGDVRFLTATETMMEWKGKEWHYVTIFMVAIAQGEGELKLMEPEKCDGWCWKSMKEAMELDSAPGEEWTFFEPVKNFIKGRGRECGLLGNPEELYRSLS